MCESGCDVLLLLCAHTLNIPLVFRVYGVRSTLSSMKRNTHMMAQSPPNRCLTFSAKHINIPLLCLSLSLSWPLCTDYRQCMHHLIRCVPGVGIMWRNAWQVYKSTQIRKTKYINERTTERCILNECAMAFFSHRTRAQSEPFNHLARARARESARGRPVERSISPDCQYFCILRFNTKLCCIRHLSNAVARPFLLNKIALTWFRAFQIN